MGRRMDDQRPGIVYGYHNTHTHTRLDSSLIQLE